MQRPTYGPAAVVALAAALPAAVAIAAPSDGAVFAGTVLAAMGSAAAGALAVDTWTDRRRRRRALAASEDRSRTRHLRMVDRSDEIRAPRVAPAEEVHRADP